MDEIFNLFHLGHTNLTFGLKTLLNVYMVLGLYAFHVLLIPLIVRISTWQFGRVDYRFHTFIAEIRQNEASLFG